MALATTPPAPLDGPGRAVVWDGATTGRFRVTVCWPPPRAALEAAPARTVSLSPTDSRSGLRRPLAATMSSGVTPNLRATLPTLSPGTTTYTIGPWGTAGAAG